MRGLMLATLATGGLLLAGHAHAQDVYTCDIDGHKVFSQTPCGAKAEVKSVGDRSIKVAIDMPQADINYFCHIAMRAWDSAGDHNSRNNTGNYYGNYYGNGNYSYGYVPSHSHEEIRDFILSHVSNLQLLSTSDPQLYQLVSNIADTYSVNSPRSGSTPAEYEANRNMLINECEAQFAQTLSDMAHSRFDADNSNNQGDESRHYRTNTLNGNNRFPQGSYYNPR